MIPFFGHTRLAARHAGLAGGLGGLLPTSQKAYNTNIVLLAVSLLAGRSHGLFGLVGRWVDRLLVWWTVGLMDCHSCELLGLMDCLVSWAVGLLGRWVVSLVDCWSHGPPFL